MDHWYKGELALSVPGSFKPLNCRFVQLFSDVTRIKMSPKPDPQVRMSLLAHGCLPLVDHGWVVVGRPWVYPSSTVGGSQPPLGVSRPSGSRHSAATGSAPPELGPDPSCNLKHSTCLPANSKKGSKSPPKTNSKAPVIGAAQGMVGR